MALEVETRTVVNKLKHPDGTVEEITVVERRPKKRHDSMMRHMQDLADGKRRLEELAAKAAETTEVPGSVVESESEPGGESQSGD